MREYGHPEDGEASREANQDQSHREDLACALPVMKRGEDDEKHRVKTSHGPLEDGGKTTS